MKTYIYTYLRKTNDRNGNPRHFINVYRMIKNKPVPLGEAMQKVGYRSPEQAVCDVILDNEAGWGKRYNSTHGTENPVQDAVTADRSGTPGVKLARLYRVGA